MMGRCAMSVLIAAVCVAWFATSATADTIILKSGRTHEGRVVTDSGGKVVFEVESGRLRTTLSFDKGDVVKIVPGTAPAPTPDSEGTAAKRPEAAPAAKPKAGKKTSKDNGGSTTGRGKASSPDGEAFLRLDLRYIVGRKELLFPEAVADEGVALEPKRGRVFMQFPVAYRLTDKARHITRGRFKVRTDAGRSCILRGIVLDPGSDQGAPSVPWTSETGEVAGVSVKAPAAGDPFWERVTPKEREGIVYVECANTSRPKTGARAQRGGRSSRGRQGGSSGTKSRYDARTADGVVLFLAEVPEDAESLVCIVKSDPPV